MKPWTAEEAERVTETLGYLLGSLPAGCPPQVRQDVLQALHGAVHELYTIRIANFMIGAEDD
jgi:hypothetical protein